MKKIITYTGLLAFSIAAVASLSFAAAPNPPAVGLQGDLPETAGVYDVAGHPNLKLKVIVYHGKPSGTGKPTPQPPVEVCGLSDTDSNAIVPAGGWILPSVWTYRLNPGSAPSFVGASNVATITLNAFAPWQSAVGSAVTIMRGADTNTNRAQFDGQNIISWGRTSGTALATTYLWYDTSVTPYATKEIDMIMNQKFSWAWSDPSIWPSKTSVGTTCAYSRVYDAQDIVTHELGHWMGLDDTYTANFSNNTMYGWGATTETKKDSLTTGDINGVRAIY